MLNVFNVCEGLFGDERLRGHAVTESSNGRDEIIWEMTLAEPGDRDTGGPLFWTLTWDESAHEFGLRRHGRPYHDRTRIGIGRNREGGLAADVLAASTVLPADRSLYAWGGAEAEFADAVVMFNTAYDAREQPVPTWSVMPRADLDYQDWPPFTTRPIPGRWFWHHVDAELMVSVNGQITEPGVFWWSSTGDDAPLLAITSEVVTPAGLVLAKDSIYVHHESLSTGAYIPTIDEILDDDAIDLGARQTAGAR